MYGNSDFEDLDCPPCTYSKCDKYPNCACRGLFEPPEPLPKPSFREYAPSLAKQTADMIQSGLVTDDDGNKITLDDYFCDYNKKEFDKYIKDVPDIKINDKDFMITIEDENGNFKIIKFDDWL